MECNFNFREMVVNKCAKIAISFLFVMLLQQVEAREKVRFSTNWYAQAQYAGYYAAVDKGFYEEVGIDVEIVYPSSGISNVDMLCDGSVDVITTFLTTAVESRMKGAPIVNIGQLSQRSSLMLVAHKNVVNELSDLDKKKVAIWNSGFGELPKYLFREKNIDVEWVPVLSTVNLFLTKTVDAMVVMWYNEYDQIINSGMDESEITKFFISDYCCNVPEDGIYCTESTLKTRGQLLSKFKEATQRGWTYVRDNQEYALNLVLKEMKAHNVSANRTHQKWMMEKMLELVFVEGADFWSLNPVDFQCVSSVLYDDGFTVVVPYADFYKP